ncbi:Ankyrin repeat-containing protein [Aspergillus mulundensis]|uniref:Ankyrin repeat-containing protein n=1 Tax=Aspergillus mulundensis TaxID=1810919 RepID=A0A3D8RQM9_9EURO|nr:Ankyrin repeat-containing protein [Aspergillus mulundensis]RDW76295.1 Ankyrin repeat-containing protein [Aspergillus mulundensis]
MSFGFSCDILSTLQLADDLKKRFAQAPSGFKAIYTDVKSLWAVLHDLHDLPKDGLCANQTMELDLIAQQGREVFLEIDNRLSKHNVIAYATPDWKSRALRAWSRVHWDPVEIESLRSRITYCLTLWNLVMSRINWYPFPLQRTNGGDIQSIKANQNVQLRNQMLASIYTVDASQQQHRILNMRHAGTGKWFLESQQFLLWVSSAEKGNNTLLCTGSPGAGKTVLASIAIYHLQTEFAGKGTVAIAYHFFTPRGRLGYPDLLSSLLRQMLQGNPDLYATVAAVAKYSMRLRSGHPLAAEEAQDMLEFAASKCTEVFIVVDALDECCDIYVRRQFLTWIGRILDLNGHTKVRFLATTRHATEPEKLFQNNHIALDVKASRDDMESFLEGNLVYLPEFLQRKPELWKDMRNQMLDFADGIFLLVCLYYNLVMHERNEKSVRALGNRIKTGSGAYDQVYDETMKRIEQQSAFSQDLARRIIGWVTFSARTLSSVELQEAIAVEIGEPEFDATNIIDLGELISVCCGLVVVDCNSNTTRLVHPTAQEYLERTWQSWFPGVHGYLTDTCLTYLSFDDRQKYPFYQYAAHEIGTHLRQDPGNGLLLDAFIKNDAKVSRCMREMLGLSSADFGFSGLHFASIMDVEDYIERLISPDSSLVNVRDHLGRTPLTWASGYGKAAAVRFLLEHGADVNPVTKEGSTPLLYAAAYGHVEVVRQLIDSGANVHVENKRIETALFFAAKGTTATQFKSGSLCSSGNHALVVQMLLDAGAEPNKKNILQETPLYAAAANGHLDAVKLLLGPRADSKTKSGLLAEALTAAARKGYIKITRLLLEHGTHPARMMMGTDVSPYFWGLRCLAASTPQSEEDIDTFTGLLRDSSSPSFRDEFHRAPLHWACWGGDVSLVQGILAAGCSPNPRDIFGRTPLFAAVCAGRVDVVKTLLDHPDIEIQIQDKLRFTPLQESYRRQVSSTNYPYASQAKAWADITDLLKARSDSPDQNLQLTINALPFTQHAVSQDSFYEHCDVCLDTRTLSREAR